MAAVASDQPTTVCSHCDRAIPSLNVDLHYAHCSRNLERCKSCGDMVPRKHLDDHYLSNHAPVSCSLCSEKMDPEILTVHKSDHCPQRMVTCEYCEFPLPLISLFEHQDVCGNRTEYCHLCSKYIRLREMNDHAIVCSSENTAESSRREGAGSDDGGQGRQPEKIPRKHLFFTIAVTGIAVVVGSFFYQRKIETRS